MPRPKRQAECHPERPHCSLGYCKTCYANYKNSLNRDVLKERARENRKRNKVKIKEAYIKKKFGISLNEYEKLKDQQNSKCAICDLEANHLDHHHGNGAVRKFLCFKCNMGLGYFNEDLSLFSKAIEYLKAHNQ